MAELEEEALRWKVHLKGFGTNPLKLPQGVRWRGLHLHFPPCFRHSSRARQRWVVSIRSSASIFLHKRFDVAAPRHRLAIASLCMQFKGDGMDTEGQRSSIPPLSLSRRAHASRLWRKSCCFSPSYFSCHFDSITQDLC